MKRISIFVAMVAVAASGTILGFAAYAKCGPVLVRITGTTKRYLPSDKIVVTVTPDSGPTKPIILREDNRFEADVYFDPFKSYSRLFGYNCTKRPEKISVALVRDGKQVDKAELDFTKDFELDSEGGYRMRAQVLLGK
jgi:hypothetical protein